VYIRTEDTVIGDIFSELFINRVDYNNLIKAGEDLDYISFLLVLLLLLLSQCASECVAFPTNYPWTASDAPLSEVIFFLITSRD
jgi:hypothetical protein